MQPLIIEAHHETPFVRLIGEDGIFLFTGKSYPENVNSFYGPIISYLELYAHHPKEKTVLEFNWLYFNTSTSKMIVKIIMLLKSKSLTVNWYCKPDDDLMLEKGEELKELLDIEFNILHS